MTHRFAVGGHNSEAANAGGISRWTFRNDGLVEGVSWQLILCAGQGLRSCFLGWYLSGWQSVLAAFCSLKKTQT